MTSHTETIRCPKCGRIQQATVKHTQIWDVYVHTCVCGYTIMESDWERVKKTKPVTKQEDKQ